MLDICGITESQMPKLFESYEAVGTLLPEMAQKLGLPENVVVCAGAGDNAAAAVGTGTVGAGDATSLWAPRVPCLSPATTSGWPPTTLCTPSPTPTAATT